MEDERFKCFWNFLAKEQMKVIVIGISSSARTIMIYRYGLFVSLVPIVINTHSSIVCIYNQYALSLLVCVYQIWHALIYAHIACLVHIVSAWQTPQ